MELLVVVIVIGVLASVAIPQFGRAIERARIAEANAVLGTIAAAEDLYYQDNNGTTYTSSTAELVVDIPADASTLHFFTYSVVGGTNTFTITATRKTGTAAGKN
ncbi:MAG: hypothetical protein HYZ90_04220, partial [Candidatus Omnitrophica bacterium]|nr:hypothetical protein [Candidatus Omnitrophota bacterium]